MKENMEDKKLFENLDDNTVEKIASRYPVGDEKERDKVFRKIEKRAGGGEFSSGDEIRGVETYRPRPYLRVVSAAAAIALVVGAAAGGGYFLLNRNGASSSKALPAAEVSETVVPTEEENIADTLVETGTIVLTEAVTEAPSEAPSDSSYTPVVLDREELITKVLGKSYEDFDRVYMEIETNQDEEGRCHVVMKSDHTAGADSAVYKWDYNEDFAAAHASEGVLLNSVELYSRNGAFVRVRDFKDYSGNPVKNYEARSYEDYCAEWFGSNDNIHRRNVSGLIEPESMFRQLVETCAFDVTGGCEYLGRECTVAGESSDDDKGWSVTVDNETGLVLKGEFILDGKAYETFAVTDLRFGEDAEPVEDASYVLSRIEGCEPDGDNTANFDLGVLSK